MTILDNEWPGLTDEVKSVITRQLRAGFVSGRELENGHRQDPGDWAALGDRVLAAGGALAERDPVAARDLDNKVAQAPGVVSEWVGDGHTALPAPLVQGVDIGDAQVTRGGAVYAGVLSQHDGQPGLPGPQQGQEWRLACHRLDIETEQASQEVRRGLDVTDFQVRPVAQQAGHGGSQQRPGRVTASPGRPAAEPASYSLVSLVKGDMMRACWLPKSTITATSSSTPITMPRP
jgi:hypothetical protein